MTALRVISYLIAAIIFAIALRPRSIEKHEVRWVRSDASAPPEARAAMRQLKTGPLDSVVSMQFTVPVSQYPVVPLELLMTQGLARRTRRHVEGYDFFAPPSDGTVFTEIAERKDIDFEKYVGAVRELIESADAAQGSGKFPAATLKISFRDGKSLSIVVADDYPGVWILGKLLTEVSINGEWTQVQRTISHLMTLRSSTKGPNQSPEPTATAVTPPAAQESRQP